MGTQRSAQASPSGVYARASKKAASFASARSPKVVCRLDPTRELGRKGSSELTHTWNIRQCTTRRRDYMSNCAKETGRVGESDRCLPYIRPLPTEAT